MSWEDQGRQDHEWFGHGTAPPRDKASEGGADAMFNPGSFERRIDAIAHSALAHMPRADRRRDVVAFDRQRLARLRKVMTAWMDARCLSDAAFAERLVDPATGNAAVRKLRAAAEGVRTAATHNDLAEASANLAAAMQDIGLDKWAGFLSDAARRAEAAPPTERTIALAQLASPGRATEANPYVDSPALTGQALADFRKRFGESTAAAYQQYSWDCSHYLQAFLKNMGFVDTPYRTTNEFMGFVQRIDSGWKQVTAEEAVRRSAEGHVVVAGLAQAGGSGHIAVVGPQMIPASLVGDHPMSPQMFSGASSNWAGARSQGEHSVADEWDSRSARNVEYWVKQ